MLLLGRLRHLEAYDEIKVSMYRKSWKNCIASLIECLLTFN